MLLLYLLQFCGYLLYNPIETCSITQEMETSDFPNLSLTNFQWLNEPHKWKISNSTLEVTTNEGGDFWQGTWYNFHVNTGHVFGVNIKDDFAFTACIEANFSELYDQAGLMIYIDEKHWLKAGIEYNDGQPMIASVFTNGVSDWATGVFTGNPRKFYLRVTKKGDVVCIKYSVDNSSWTLLRLCTFPKSVSYFVGPMTCTPKRAGLEVKFSDIAVTEPQEDILHSN